MVLELWCNKRSFGERERERESETSIVSDLYEFGYMGLRQWRRYGKATELDTTAWVCVKRFWMFASGSPACVTCKGPRPEGVPLSIETTCAISTYRRYELNNWFYLQLLLYFFYPFISGKVFWKIILRRNLILKETFFLLNYNIKKCNNNILYFPWKKSTVWKTYS